ncbi:hypothetical protein AAB992_14020 [Burkholderia contaminans]|uniref:hypothetical protein n=1 Tax=Burkholderia contaminans TaxID=488447 RepID=UPI002416F854|nr:hypothetical protein [Burkholderia contaminans]WFN14410.1 hypothetical protein LXE92_36495 [Burkholderia contaminans]
MATNGKPTLAVPPEPSDDMVTVACKLPQGLHLDIVKHGEVRRRVTLNGANSSHAVAGFGITERVPKAFFEQWLAEHQELPAIRNELIFALPRRADVEAMAAERVDMKSGLEPLDPKKPGKDLAPLSKE